MSSETLQTLWFILIAVLWIGFFVLEGFDFGVGMLLPFIGKKDEERRAVINTIGPHWDGNEVWLLTAGGATFAAFPQWYATMFSGFYLAFFLLLLGLIVRGVAFEFRSKHTSPKWRAFWDWAIFGGSLVPALLLGVAFANLATGLPIDAEMHFTGNLLTLLVNGNGYALAGGLLALSVFALHGTIFLSLKLEGEMQVRARALARKLWGPAMLIVLVYAVWTFFATDFIAHLGIDPGIFPLGAVITILLVGTVFLPRNMDGWAFITTALHLVLTQVSFFMLLFPRVMISTTDPAYSLTIYNASSSPYTLQVMSIVALIFVPLVLAYQGYTYWVFRQRVSTDVKKMTY
ncbi:MAG: cytochrome d ubiquinol oxidase subunit II [Anaerolineales bacterium]